MPPNWVKHRNNHSVAKHQKKVHTCINNTENRKEGMDGQTWRRLKKDCNCTFLKSC